MKGESTMPDRENSKGYEYMLVVLFFLGWGFIFLDRLAVAFMTPTIGPALQLSNAQIAMLGFVTTGAFAVSSALGGFISDKTGFRKRLLVICILGSGAVSILAAFAKTYESLLCVRALTGVFGGPIFPIMLTLIGSTAPQNFGRNAGIVNMGAGVIAVSMGPLMLTQMAKWVGWNNAFLLTCVPNIVIALIVAKYVKEIRVEKSTGESQKNSLAEIFAYRNIVICMLIAVFGMAGYWTMLLYVPNFLANATSPEKMSFILMVMGLMGMVYTALVPKLSDNVGRRPILIWGYLLSGVPPLLMFLLHGGTLSIGAYILLAGIPGALLPIWMSIIPMETVPSHLQGTCSGFILGVGEFLGGAILPIFVGKFADSQGSAHTMLLGAVIFFVTAAFSLMLKESLAAKARK